MSMKIDLSRVKAERLKRAWSQEQLAQIAGLGLRTVNRIEKSGQCSLESQKALAAAFDLLPEELQVNAQSSVSTSFVPSSFVSSSSEPGSSVSTIETDSPTIEVNSKVSKFSSIRKFISGGLVGAFLATLSFMLADSVMAAQVHLDIQGSIDQEHIQSELLTDNGAEAVIQFDGLMRMVLTPTINENDTVMLKAKIYTWENEAFVLVAQPAMKTIDRSKVAVRLSLPSGQEIAFFITPEIRD